jgi:hypothetical protein
MTRTLVNEVLRIQHQNNKLFKENILHILNGQLMYDEFHRKNIMGEADYVPFNEAMCVNEVTYPIFDHTFNETRANGHSVSAESYFGKVVAPLQILHSKFYETIVLWFGEDVFCQMNVLTALAYLEQIHFSGNVYLQSFNEDDFKVNEEKLTLGTYTSVFKQVLIDKTMPTAPLLPVMVEAIKRHLDMQKEQNEVTNYIQLRPDLPEMQLVNELLHIFTILGYGDTQYMQLIRKVRG